MTGYLAGGGWRRLRAPDAPVPDTATAGLRAADARLRDVVAGLEAELRAEGGKIVSLLDSKGRRHEVAVLRRQVARRGRLG